MSAKYIDKCIPLFILLLFISSFSFSQHATKDPGVTHSDIDQALLKVAQLEPKAFDYAVNKSGSNHSLKQQPYGFVPENMRKVFPELVSQAIVADKIGKNLYRNRSTLTVNDTGLIPILVASIHELQGEIEKLKAEISELKANTISTVRK